MNSEQFLAQLTAHRPKHWLLGFGIALLAHLAMAAWIMNSRASDQSQLSTGAPMVIAMADFAAAPNNTIAQAASLPPESAPQPSPASEPEPKLEKQPEPELISEPEPEPEVESEPAPEAESEPESESEPEPDPKPEPEPESEPQSEPSGQVAQNTVDATASAAQAAETTQSQEAHASDSQVVSQRKANWEGRMAAHLERHKRYPYTARSRREEGVAVLRFSIDRKGRVTAVELEKGSGYFLLDREVEAMLRRAEPLPAPPSEIKGDTVEVVLPIEFALR